MSTEPPIAGLCNIRDVPGVRDGLVRRCDLPRWLDVDDVAALGGVATQIDLRSHEEAELDGVGVLVDHGVVRHHLPYGERVGPITPVGEGARDIEANYRAFTQMGLYTVVDGFELLTSVELPALVHCTAGKDRTGVFVIALSLALGVSPEEAIEDYLASAHAMEEVERRFWTLPSTLARANPVPPAAYPVTRVLPSVVVDEIQDAGGVEAWVGSGGAAPDLIPRLRARIGKLIDT